MSREPTAEEIAAARAIARRDYDGEDLWDSFTSGRQADLIEVARAALEAAAALSASPPEADGERIETVLVEAPGAHGSWIETTHEWSIQAAHQTGRKVTDAVLTVRPQEGGKA